MRTVSVIIPAYREEANIESVYERLAQVFEPLAVDWELIFCVDPSPDRTEELILELRKHDPRVKMLRFSRRFGQPMATLAGLEAAGGDAAVVIDCDLQDPPELIPVMIQRWQEGFDVVYAQRRTRAGETLPKRIVAWAGYKVINRIAEVDIPPNTGDFRLMSRRVINNVVALKEGHGFLRGLVGFVGFRQTSVPYDRSPRAAGSSKYNQMMGSLLIGFNGVVGFSRYPLQLISLAGHRLLRPRVPRRGRVPRPENRGRRLPDRQPDDRRRGRILQRNPAAVARGDGGVRRTDLRRNAPEAEVHRGVEIRSGRPGSGAG